MILGKEVIKKLKIKLDYTIEEMDKRLKEVAEICDENEEELNSYNLEQMADYLIYQMEKQERRERKILTPNRLVTVNKRETSFEGIVSKFEKNEDGVYGIMNEDKNTILTHKVSITPKDIEEIPFLKQIRDSIEKLKALPDRNYIIQQAIIDLSQTQYMIKNAYRKPMRAKSTPPPTSPSLDWCALLNLKDWKTVSEILRYYSKLKTNVAEKFESDMYWILQDFETLVDCALKENHPMLYDIMRDKTDGLQNNEIQARLEEKYGHTYSVEYISSLFNNKIPKLIADTAEAQELIYHYTFIEKGAWKRCNRCGQVKLLHSRFFSKNSSSSKNGFYSICKDCRNKKKGAD